MFGISGEHLVILGIILLIFGPKRLPQLGNTLGKAIKNFKDGVSGVENAEFRKLEDRPEIADTAPRTPKEPKAPADDTGADNDPEKKS